MIRLLVITSCTGEKAVERKEQLVLEDFQDPDRLRNRERELGPWLRPARAMYTGAQHLALMRGVGEIRRTYDNSAVRLWIVSIGYGIVPEDRLIAPYKSRSFSREFSSNYYSPYCIVISIRLRVDQSADNRRRPRMIPRFN
jgi:hypothetical protein